MDEKFSSVGGRIVSRLQEKALKQADLCRETGISTNAISQYVTGKRIPDTASLYKLSHALDVSMEWLLTGVDTSNESASKHELSCDGVPLTASEADLVAMYRLLPSTDKKEVFNYAFFKYDSIEKGQASIYSTYEDTQESQDENPKNMSNSGSGIA